jgi:protein-tyrosine kinase
LMSMIEQASKRLEQLGQAGFTVPTSVSRLRVLDDADAHAARRRVAVPARSLSDAAKAEDASSAADAPAHFSPALSPTFARAAVVGAPNSLARVEPVAEPVAELRPAVAHAEPAAAAPVAKVVHPALVDLAPASDPAAFFAPFAEAEKAMSVDARPASLARAEPTWFEVTPVAQAVVAPVAATAAVIAPVAVVAAAVAPTTASVVEAVIAQFVAQPAAQAAAQAVPPVLAPAAPVRVAPPQAPVLSVVVDASLAHRAEPSTRVSFDLERLRGVGYLVPDQVRSEMAEQFRHLKRPLLKNARAKTGPAGLCSSHIMITSALPGEGKTFSSINLAMSMAMEVDTAVLLIDADVVRPSVFNRLGINIKPPGLLDLLTRDDLPLHEALVSTNVPKLTLMASGERNQRSTELLASTAMDKLLARLAVEYPDHVVIFDAPPLLLTNESPVLATKVGQVVVVVEALKTRRTVIQQAFAALKNCPVVHSVLNKCDEATEGRRYGYYYG